MQGDRNLDILKHICDYCNEINYTMETFGRDFLKFKNNSIYQNATAMCVLQIGELTTHFTDGFKVTYNKMPWNQIKALRNIVAHNYGKVDKETLWETLLHDIPELDGYCRLIMNEYDAKDSIRKEIKNMLEKITVNEQNSIRIAGEKTVYFDPFQIREATHDADIIFITHVHHDHFSPQDYKKAAKEDTIFVVPASMKADALEAGIAENKLMSFCPGETSEVLGIPVETIPSYNLEKAFHPKEKAWIGYVVTMEGKRIYVAGDMDATPESRQVSCDIAILPIGGHYTMDAKMAAQLVNEIKPEAVIPVHYGTIVGKISDADDFAEAVDASVKVVQKIFV